MQKIAENVYVETSFSGCNVSFVVTTEGVLMIDTPMAPADALKWRDEIAQYGQVCYLVNTEPHIDHFAGNGFFDGTVVAHEGTREAILNASVEQLRGVLASMLPVSSAPEDDFSFSPPAITLSQRLTLYLGKHTFKLINMPGHSPFQVVVYVPEEGVMFTSDNVVNGSPPFMHQALPYEWLESLQQMRQLEADIFVPGHGNICNRGYLRKMSNTVQTWIDAVSEAIDKGMSLEEALNDISILDSRDERTKQIQHMNITHLYEVLKK